ncbi:MAG: nitroreductase family deazaflavin-dependent oxidoreductase [Actinomycetia bacterium]|nr:nitroreductase family deazaflavin-dependent oxidoreductase [Actinomycetes bacterium]MCP4221973.1 nitroreductase family deazaflavin-dependent oxidoreductase [Actinomycetes bacterium]
MSLDQQIIKQLAETRVIDFTTTGCRSGQPARIEIWWFRIRDRFIITGTPGPRDWLANVRADPAVIIHTPFGDFPGRAELVDDRDLRRDAMTHPDLSWYQTQAELDALVDTSPMIEITLEGEG